MGAGGRRLCSGYHTEKTLALPHPRAGPLLDPPVPVPVRIALDPSCNIPPHTIHMIPMYVQRGWKRSGSTDTESMRSFGESRLILSEDKMDRTLAMLLRLPGIERLTLSTLGNQKRYTNAINAIGDRLKVCVSAFAVVVR